MNPIDKVIDKDRETLRAYLREFSGTRDICNLDEWLRYWDVEKANLFNIFGSELILEKEIAYNQDVQELTSAMNEEFSFSRIHYSQGDIIGKALESYYLYVKRFYDPNLDWGSSEHRNYNRLLHLMTNSENLVSNIYNEDDIMVPAEMTVDGKGFAIKKGTKVMRAIRKCFKSFGLNMDEFEAYCNRHSQILNQKKLTGTLCLSIHPMDYITMSDNDCDWHSCMNWTDDDPGEYRIGTVEMMNSEYVVVAYLKAKEDYSFTSWDLSEARYRNYEWNNKKWRQLLVINEDVILGNRQYPYTNSFIEHEAMNWLRELAQAAGFSEYNNEPVGIKNHQTNIVFDKKIRFDFNTNMMYNDVYDIRTAYLSNDFISTPPPYDDCDTLYCQLNFSGIPLCVECGQVIDTNNNPQSILCRECNNEYICDHCGHYTSEDDIVEVDDLALCQYCYEEHTVYCPMCQNSHYEDNFYAIPLIVVSDADWAEEYNKNEDVIDICNECYGDLCTGEETIFGEVIEIPEDIMDHYNSEFVFDIASMTERGFRRASEYLGYYARRHLEKVLEKI